MGWFSKLFKRSKHKRANYEDHTDHYAPSSTSGDVSSENENEDIESAIALSLAGGNENGNNVNDSNSQSEEDEQLARAIYRRIKLGSPPRYGNGNVYEPYPYPTYFPADSRICACCNIDFRYGRYLHCLNAFWHTECFRCLGCNQPISDYEFSAFGSFPYNKSCYEDNYIPKCDVCYNLSPLNHAGLMEYRMQNFWMQRFCPSHVYDGTPTCCSCERLEGRGAPYTDLSDGRKICLECMESAIMDTDQCQPLYNDVHVFFESLNMKLDQDIPLYLVERHALNEAREGEPKGHCYVSEVRGLCLFLPLKENKQPGIGKGKTRLCQPARHCDVTAIHILFGLPRLLTGTILAHEMMHAWMRLEGYETLDQHVEEGICQVVAYLWLEAELSSGSSSNFAPASSSSAYNAPRTLGDFCKHQIESNMSPVYGDGFRAAMQAVRNHGLRATLHHIRMTGSLPY